MGFFGVQYSTEMLKVAVRVVRLTDRGGASRWVMELASEVAA